MTSFSVGRHNSAIEGAVHTSLTLPAEYPLVLLAAGISLSASSALGFTIGALYRQRANIAYPTLYATEEQCRTNPAAFTFNCAQRCHANYVENLFPMVGSMLVAGLRFPRQAAAFGAAWVLARGIYVVNYVQMKHPSEGGKLGVGLGPLLWWVPQWSLHFLALRAAIELVSSE